jgi:hypothetical protein
MKQFYIHKQTPYGKFNGFTAKVEPTDNPRTVKVAVAFCSKKDHFCKATGRNVVEQHTFTEINKRSLADWLGKQEDAAWGQSGMFSGVSFLYTLKYVV